MEDKHQEVLRELAALQEEEVSIITISEPISTTIWQGTNKRVSDASQDAFETPTPCSLEADLTHYKELFSKLRFSYLEQVTKEKFIRAIVSDPPLLVEHKQNVELEGQLADAKAALKQDKIAVADMVEELGRRGRDLSQRYDAVNMQTTRLRDLPAQIEDIRESVTRLKVTQVANQNPIMNLSLDRTVALVQTKEEEAAELDHVLERLQADLTRKERMLERAEAELHPLDIKRLGSAAAAKEAKRRKDEALDGIGDDLEERGRWWRGVESGLKVMLDADCQN